MEFKVIIECRLTIGKVVLKIGVGRKSIEEFLNHISFGRGHTNVRAARREIAVQHFWMYRSAHVAMQVSVIRPRVYSSLLDHRHPFHCSQNCTLLTLLPMMPQS